MNLYLSYAALQNLLRALQNKQLQWNALYSVFRA